MRGWFALGAGIVVAACSAAVAACSTTTIVQQAGPGGADGGGGGTLPEVGADQLGQSCSGGTSPGDTATFADDTCPAGLCVVDARGGIDAYCSVDCDKASCPAGYVCEAVNHGTATHACFKDPNATAADAAPASFLDTKVTGYRAGSASKTQLSLRDFASTSTAPRELVVAILEGSWDGVGNRLATDLESSSITGVAWVFVMVQGASTGADATTADLDRWHADYGYVNALLDPALKTLAPLGPFEAFPSFVVFDAVTMKEVARDVGYDATSFDAAVATWKTKAKAVR